MVYLDDIPPFPAQTVKLIPQYALDKFVPGQSVVAVRVSPADRSRVVIDLATRPPAVRLAAGSTEFSAASILATGTPCQAIIVGIEPAGVKNPSGFESPCQVSARWSPRSRCYRLAGSHRGRRLRARSYCNSNEVANASPNDFGFRVPESSLLPPSRVLDMPAVHGTSIADRTAEIERTSSVDSVRSDELD